MDNKAKHKNQDKCCSTKESGNEKHHHEHDHNHQINSGLLHLFLPSIISFLLLISGLVFDHLLNFHWFNDPLKISLYFLAYLPVGIPVAKEAYESIMHKDFFSEFFLMTIASIGAFIIGEYPEGVAVMLFYSIGEIFQSLAVQNVKSDIQKLLDQRPEEVTVIRNQKTERIKAETAKPGEILQLKPGEKVGLDGVLQSNSAVFNTAALTGESVPETKYKGDTIFAGMINLNAVTYIEVNAEYKDSQLSRILELVEHATKQKAPTELFIRKFARKYTPVVVGLALAICILPHIFIEDYSFKEGLYKALVFLVISCPCALVISIPLGYFGGIGAAGKNGILVKGSNYLDILAAVQHVVMDKTGTLTEGIFKVQEVIISQEFDKATILQWVNALENLSSHPIAAAIHAYAGPINHQLSFQEVEEISGLGIKAKIEEKTILIGNFKLMNQFSIAYDIDLETVNNTTVAIAFDGKFVGYILITDQIKADALACIQKLHALKIKTSMLSGDKSTVVKSVAKKLGIQNAFGELLPEDKAFKIKELKDKREKIAFVGDGINDAPVVALSDVGIAMGGLGSDATIATADVVIQDDKPSKIPMAIEIGKATKRIVWQNIIMAFAVKGIVLMLGAGGLATMWEAVFADVGVALLAILNAVRIQKMKF